MPTRHTISHAENFYRGDVYYERYAKDHGGRRGVEFHPIHVHEFGAVATLLADVFIDAATSTELPDTETVTYTTATDGTSPLDKSGRPATVTITKAAGGTALVWPIATPRNIVSTTTHGSSVVAMTITISGYDQYFEAMSELHTVTATGTSKVVNGKKAFAYVESIAITAAADAEANTLNLGTGDVFGLPFRVDEIFEVVPFNNSIPETGATVVVADTTTATTSTGDVRGTVDFTDAADASKKFAAWIHIKNTDTKANVFGITQA